MAAEKRELLLDLLARDKTKQATDSAARNLDNVGDSADDATKSTEKLTKATVVAGEELDDLGKAARDNADRVGKLDREIGLVENELGDLARAFADTNVAAERLDISKAVRRMENDLRRLNKNKGVLEGLLPKESDIDGPAKVVGRSLMKSIGAGITSAGESVATKAGASVGPVVGGAIAAAAAPVLVSSLASVLAAGAGAGVIGAGIAVAVARDDKIQAAGANAGQRFMRGLGKAATENFRGPILQSIGILSDAGDRLSDSLGETFRELGDDVVPFTRKVVGAGEAVTGSLLHAAQKSGPALDGLGDAITLVGDGVGDFIAILADGGPEAADNLRLIAGATADLFRMTAVSLDQLNKLSNNPWISGALLPMLRKHYADAAKESDNLKGSTQALIPPLNEAEKAARGQTVALAGLSKEMRSQSDPAFALREAQIKLAAAQKASNDAVAKHGPKSREAREATRNLATAAIDLQGRVGALGKDFDGKLTPAMRSTLIAAGLTERQINDVEREFGAAKRAGDKYAKTYAATTKVYGAAAARKSLFSVKEVADGIPRTVSIAMRITGVTNVSKAAASIRKQYSTGGKVDGPGTGTSDSIPAMLSKGEYVVRAAQVQKPGVQAMLDALNSGTAYGMRTGSSPPGMGRGGTGGGVQTVRLALDLTGAEGQMLAMVRSWFADGLL
jgi:hypothetical protein